MARTVQQGRSSGSDVPLLTIGIIGTTPIPAAALVAPTYAAGTAVAAVGDGDVAVAAAPRRVARGVDGDGAHGGFDGMAACRRWWKG